MIAGLVLSEKEDEESYLAFLGDNVSCTGVGSNDEIVELVEERKPEVLAVDASTEKSRKPRTEREEELEEEGYVFTPAAQQKKKVRRLEALESRLFERMGGERPEIVRFDPQITADELGIHGDPALESYGVDTSCLESALQFDAMLGAVTARFYQQNQVEDLGVIIPEPLDSGE